MGFLHGKTKLRRIYRWCKSHISELTQYMPLPFGVPSVSTMSRILSMVDADRTPYILNAIDVATQLVIGQLAIHEKTNEMTAIPELVEMMDLFDDLKSLKEKDKDEFEKVSGETYCEHKTSEKNRERYEHRKVEYYDGKEWIEHFQEDRPSIQSVGRTSQPIVTVGDGFKDVVQKAGLVANRKMNAKEMLEYHRNHWTIENSLHYVLDETFGEDKCTVRKGKNALYMLRKCAYNIARLLQNKNPKERPYIPDVLDDIADQFELAAGYIFKAVPAF